MACPLPDTYLCYTTLLVVSAAGELIATGDWYEPSRLAGPGGAAVGPVTAFFRDLLAAGRVEATVRSYGMDLPRWFRFIWATGNSWDRADQQVARDFSRWLQVSARAGRGYAPAARAYSETVLRGFCAYHLEARDWPGAESVSAGPVPAAWTSRRASQPDGELPGRAERPLPGPGCPRVPRAVSDEEYNAIFGGSRCGGRCAARSGRCPITRCT